ncbi:MAG: ABC transporter permease subunit [Myxococcota bacterium]
MKSIQSIATKELRGFFKSGIGPIFLAVFLGIVLFTFFWVEQFFVRNIADIRPMFTWLPLLLIFLVAALSMRLWSEEQKLGTLEVLLTLPVPIRHLVLGKFVAGIVLIVLALALTLGLPITVSMMGELDWGPVWGGYIGAVLLASAYLSIGLCVSSLTDNQVVALIGTSLFCAVLYSVGAAPIAGLLGNAGSEILRGIGMGSRFESIGRGVLDLRDIIYYSGFIVFFLLLNTVILESKRWSKGERTRKSRQSTSSRLV